MERQLVSSARFPAARPWSRGFVAMLAVALLLCVKAPVAQSQVQLPTIPEPVAVSLDPHTTALLVLDVTTVTCPLVSCTTGTLPAVASLLQQARATGALVVFRNISVPGSTILPEIAPLSDEAVITIPPRGTGDDAWAGMDLVLKAHGIKTVVLVGILANVAVMYSAWSATWVDGYTVVVADDAIAAAPFPLLLARYQMLNEIPALWITPRISRSSQAPSP